MIIYANDGAALSVETVGEGIPLLMLHGGLVDTRSWIHQRRLADEIKLILPDTRGFGGSADADASLTADRLCQDVCAAIAAAAEDRVHLLGFSMGGVIAQMVALRHPDRVRSLILESTFANPAPPRPPGDPADISAHVRRAFSASYRSANPAFMAEYTAMASFNAARGAMPHIRRAVEEGPSTDDLRLISVPTLVIHARDDGSIPFPCGETLAGAIDGARLCAVEGAGHTIHIEVAELFNEQVLSFVLTAESSNGLV